MKQSSIVQQLSSNDPDTILDGLFAFGALRDELPNPDTFRLAVRHLASEDPDVRRQAVLAVVIHWGHLPAFERLAVMVSTEQDHDVLSAVLSGLSRLAREDANLVGKALTLLRDFCFSHNGPLGLRRRAFLEAKTVVGELDIGDRASSPAGDGPDEPSEEWFELALHRFEAVVPPKDP